MRNEKEEGDGSPRHQDGNRGQVTGVGVPHTLNPMETGDRGEQSQRYASRLLMRHAPPSPWQLQRRPWLTPPPPPWPCAAATCSAGRSARGAEGRPVGGLPRGVGMGMGRLTRHAGTRSATGWRVFGFTWKKPPLSLRLIRWWSSPLWRTCVPAAGGGQVMAAAGCGCCLGTPCTCHAPHVGSRLPQTWQLFQLLLSMWFCPAAPPHLNSHRGRAVAAGRGVQRSARGVDQHHLAVLRHKSRKGANCVTVRAKRMVCAKRTVASCRRREHSGRLNAGCLRVQGANGGGVPPRPPKLASGTSMLTTPMGLLLATSYSCGQAVARAEVAGGSRATVSCRGPAEARHRRAPGAPLSPSQRGPALPPPALQWRPSTASVRPQGGRPLGPGAGRRIAPPTTMMSS